MERKKRILQGIDTSRGVGLELGPLAAPVLRKDEANIMYLDHMSLEKLKERYANEPVDLDDIVAPDFVLDGRMLPETVGNKKFDYIVASHVIEHIPDTVTWLKEVASVLNEGGVISLVIPDKRFTFDINRRVSTPAEVIGAYLDGQKRFSSTMMYDFAIECLVDVPTGEAWSNPEQFTTAPPRWSKQEVYDMCQQNLDPKQYVDCHCFVFTPASFVEVLRELIEQGLLDFEVAHFLETQENEIEFYVTLRKVSKSKTSIKQQLATLPKVDEENKFEVLKQENVQLANEVFHLKEEIAALKNSTSWRVTRGLRAVKGTRSRKGK